MSDSTPQWLESPARAKATARHGVTLLYVSDSEWMLCLNANTLSFGRRIILSESIAEIDRMLKPRTQR